MSDTSMFVVTYAEDPTSDDRAALERPGFKLYPNGIEVSDAWFVGGQAPPSKFHARQVVRLEARDSEQAKRLVVNALGRTPPGLEAVSVT